MKKLLPIIFASILFFGFSFAANLNFEDFLVVYFEGVSINLGKNGINTDELCQNTPVKYTNVSQGTKVYNALQKGICLNLFPNVATTLPLSDYITQDRVVQLLSSDLKNKLRYSKGNLIDATWAKGLIDQTVDILGINGITNGNVSDILEDIKYRLKNQSLYGSGIDWDNKKCNNITGCVNLLDDEYTEFYNSDQAQNLYESLEGEFSGIGAYIGTDGQGLFGITEVIQGGPAEKAGLKAGDIFVQIDDYVLNSKSTTDIIRSHIKGTIGTKVYIKIKRGNQYLEFNIKRELISLPNIDYEVLGGGICFMSIKQFNEKTLDQFEAGLRNFYMNNCKIYLFDLRDNAGGELNTVVNMLNHFVNSGDTIVQMRYNDFTENIVANGYGEKIKNKSIFMFVNEMTASASEIFVGTIKDYVKNSVLVGSKTYGKGSAQTLIEYADGSILKYTIAKWYTGKSNKNIDGVGFNPDVTLRPDQVTSLINALKAKK